MGRTAEVGKVEPFGADEVREVVVGGVIRAADITSSNTISYDQMAEARISYGCRGQLTDVQQPRLGSQVLDVIMPF